jgi:hypothetical protein
MWLLENYICGLHYISFGQFCSWHSLISSFFHVLQIHQMQNCFLSTFKNYFSGQSLVSHTFKPSLLRGWDQEIVDWGQPRKWFERSHLQNNQSKMGWRCGSIHRATALQAWSSDFKPQSHQKKKKNSVLCTFHFLFLPWLVYFIMCSAFLSHWPLFY